MTTVAERERAALADLFDVVGPDQPTLCEGWDTHDLLTHLVVRERRVDAGVASVIPPLRGWAKRVAREYHRRPWKQEVELLREGPQRFNPIRLEALDSAVNTAEYFIHHEDVRRGKPGWVPRVLDRETEEAVTRQVLSLLSKLALRSYGVGFRVRFPDGTEHEIARGEPVVTLVGAPGEVLLWVSGRRQCEVEVTGPPEAQEAVAARDRARG